MTRAGGFAMFRGDWRTTTYSRNAVRTGLIIEQFGGHFVMRPVFLAAHGFWAAGRV